VSHHEKRKGVQGKPPLHKKRICLFLLLSFKMKGREGEPRSKRRGEEKGEESFGLFFSIKKVSIHERGRN